MKVLFCIVVIVIGILLWLFRMIMGRVGWLVLMVLRSFSFDMLCICILERIIFGFFVDRVLSVFFVLEVCRM